MTGALVTSSLELSILMVVLLAVLALLPLRSLVEEAGFGF
jgi:hypothetical protein